MIFNTAYKSILEQVEQIDPVGYGQTRNFFDGQVTHLSPYLSRGVISSHEVVRMVMERHYPVERMERLLQELSWREYFQRVWQNKQELLFEDLKQTQPDFERYGIPSSIVHADTKLTAIDEKIAELYHSGYMHNHARMYVAALCCNFAKVHWKQPAGWLYYHLFDGDIASNTCNWQWVSGAFASKKYYFNQENLNKYSRKSQFDTFLDVPYEELPKLAVPGILKQTEDLSFASRLPKNLLPVIDPSMPTLIYNSYNLDPTWRKDANANRVLLLEPSHFSRFPISERVMEFILGLSENIDHIQVFTGEFNELRNLYTANDLPPDEAFISKKHPAFNHYLGKKDSYEWLFADVKGYFPSFFSYWKACKRRMQVDWI